MQFTEIAAYADNRMKQIISVGKMQSLFTVKTYGTYSNHYPLKVNVFCSFQLYFSQIFPGFRV
jgi:hypothetical protein